MITPQMTRRCELAKQDVAKSNLQAAEKETLLEGLESSLSACNGLSTAEKIDANANNQYWTALVLTRMYLRVFDPQDRVSTWKDVVHACRWQICILVGAVSIMLAIRPELAKLIEAVAK